MNPRSISVVIPACDSAKMLARCLEALSKSALSAHETIVVDDGSIDATCAVAAEFGAQILHTGRRRGPAFARNLGARSATGEILLFLDSDVCVKTDTLGRIAERFNRREDLDALMGSYDSVPGSPDFLSQYRNLMHSYVHHTGAGKASTFWSGCGAIRREVFLEQSGFSESYERPAIEDIELGYRLVRSGKNVMLDSTIQVTHLKRWTFWGLLKTDVLDRGIPWTELILRDRFMPGELNLQLSQRVSVALVFLLVALSVTVVLRSGVYMLIAPLAIVIWMLGAWWGEFGIYRRPRRAFAMLNGMLLLVAALAYHYRMFALIPALALQPAILFLRHRYSKGRDAMRWTRWFSLCFICLSVAAATQTMFKAHHLIFACLAIFAVIGVLNSQFYIFLAGKRGWFFMLAAIPFHLLYHFYNGVSFTIGVGRHSWMVLRGSRREQMFPIHWIDQHAKSMTESSSARNFEG